MMRPSFLAACALLAALFASPAPGGAQSDTMGRPVLDQFAAAWASVASYTATVTVTERTATQVQSLVFDYAFRKPSTVNVRVNAGPNAGVTMVWDGGATIVAHRGSGFAALFKKTLSLHDPQAMTVRGSSIDQLSFGAILAHAQQQAGRVTEQAPGVVDGTATQAIALVSADPAANAGLTREVVELSASTHLPVQVLGYAGTTLVRQIDFSNVTLQRENPPHDTGRMALTPASETP